MNIPELSPYLHSISTSLSEAPSLPRVPVAVPSSFIGFRPVVRHFMHLFFGMWMGTHFYIFWGLICSSSLTSLITIKHGGLIWFNYQNFGAWPSRRRAHPLTIWRTLLKTCRTCQDKEFSRHDDGYDGYAHVSRAIWNKVSLGKVGWTSLPRMTFSPIPPSYSSWKHATQKTRKWLNHTIVCFYQWSSKYGSKSFKLNT